ncbi:hypothetical protein C8A05DRAFT_39533 [Staphylotrichum tortipilum]|uniref:Bromodomain associated domain-containing protein n=1 Tax=Staphylotrichum tortipilum TaxID=2831512 RepID=A0AAN6MBC3_9PEZI|nr:hypothetical protein C8A05DRAFT_39533 [Staphylotrichum longicolle]
MTPPPPLYHALLRPAVLQILRATGYHSAKTSVLDSVTDLAARYFLNLCHVTAVYATHNSNRDPDDEDEEDAYYHYINGINGTTAGGGGGDELLSFESATVTATAEEGGAAENGTTATTMAAAASAAALRNPVVPAPTIIDVRMALERVGALLPARIHEEQEYLGSEDLRGMEGFVAWATGALNREIARIALDGNDEAGDYLDALKKKHSKNEDDSKYLGTLLGRSIEHGDVIVEGGEYPSISAWEERRRLAGQKTPEPQPLQVNGAADADGQGEDSRPPSSGLSSLGDRSIADEMDMS